MPPLGILFIGATLEKEGHEVQVVDLTGVVEWKPLVRRALDDSPDLIGLTCTTPQYPRSLAIREEIRQQGWTGPLTIGGIHVTSDPDGVLADQWEGVCVGEGERATVQMLEDLRNGGLHGLYQMPLVRDLDSLGHPARHLLNIRSYKYDVGGRAATTTFSQRGCVYRCSFCESPLAGGFTVRYHSPEWVRDDVLHVKELGFGAMMFFDDEMNIDIPRLYRVCELIKPLDIKWRCFVVASKTNKEILRTMKEAGCHEVGVGFESGSPQLLKNIHKPQTVEIMKRFAQDAHEVGLRFKAFCIVGLPGESWDTVRMTEKMLEETKPDDLDVSILQVYPGSPIYVYAEEYHRKGLSWEINYNPEKLWYKSSPEKYGELIQVSTPYMSRSELIAARNYLELKFKSPEWREKHIKKTPWERLDADLPYVREWIKRLV